MDDSYDYSTQICYAYARAGRSNLSNIWADLAYKRKPNAINAYNLSCKHSGEEQEKYLRLALEHDLSYTSALMALGRILYFRNDKEGIQLLERAKSNIMSDYEFGSTDSSNAQDLLNIADMLDDEVTKRKAKTLIEEISSKEKSSVYSDTNLVQTKNNNNLLNKE